MQRANGRPLIPSGALARALHFNNVLCSRVGEALLCASATSEPAGVDLQE